MCLEHSATLVRHLNGMLANVRREPGAGELRRLCNKGEIVAGLLAYRALLKAMYGAPQYLEGKDDDEKAKLLEDTVILLYTCAVFGKLKGGSAGHRIVIDKEVLLA